MADNRFNYEQARNTLPYTLSRSSFLCALCIYPDGSAEDNVSFDGNAKLSSKRNHAGEFVHTQVFESSGPIDLKDL